MNQTPKKGMKNQQTLIAIDFQFILLFLLDPPFPASDLSLFSVKNLNSNTSRSFTIIFVSQFDGILIILDLFFSSKPTVLLYTGLTN